MYSKSRLIGGPLSLGLDAKPLLQVSSDVETRVLHWSVVSALEHSRLHAQLDVLADSPILAIHTIPEGDSVGGIEPRCSNLGRMEQEVTDHGGMIGLSWPDGICSDVVGGQADHAVGIDQLPLMTSLLVWIQTLEGTPRRSAGFSERPGPISMRNATLPIQLRPSPVLERRHQTAQLGMHRPAVIALVVVLQDHLPVGPHLVGDPVSRSKLVQGVATQSSGNTAKLIGQVVLRPVCRSQLQKEEPAPGLNRDRKEPQISFAQAVAFIQEGRGSELPLERVGPGVIRATNGPGETTLASPRHEP